MYATHQITSFTAGELSPWMGARIDLGQYANGAASLENFVVRPYGGLERRSGSRWVAFAKQDDGPVRLFPFKYALGDQFILEVGLGYVRFFKSGAPLLLEDGTPYEVETPWDTPDMLNDLRFTQVNDVIYCVCPQRAPHKLSRYQDLKWKLEECTFSPYPKETLIRQKTRLSVTPETLNPDLNVSLFFDGSVLTEKMAGNEIIIAGCEKDEKVLFQNGFVPFQGREINGSFPEKLYEGDSFFQRGKNGWMYFYTARRVIPAGTELKAGEAEYRKDKFMSGYLVLDNEYPYEVFGGWEVTTSGTWNATWELWRSYDKPTAYDRNFYEWNWECIRTFRQDPFTERKNWALSGEEKRLCYMMLVCVSSPGDMGRPVFRRLAATRDYEFRLRYLTNESIAMASPLRSSLEPIPSFSTTKWSFGAFGPRNGFPRAVGMYQGRLWLAGTPGQPTTLRASAIDDFSDFGTGTDDSSPLSLTVAATSQNAICWISPAKQMLFGTTEGEWMVAPSTSEGTALTPKNVSITKQSSVGSEPLEAGAMENSVVYVQRGGFKMREISYKLEADGFTSTDMSIFAEHLTEPGIVEWTVQHADANFIWVVVKNGDMAVLTHYPDQNVIAWHRHKFAGAKVERIACIMGSNNTFEDMWMVTARNVNGTMRRCIEVYSREGAFLDSYGICIAGQPDRCVLQHLAGELLTAYPVGEPERRVQFYAAADGSFDLPGEEGREWVVGLSYTSSLQTMPFDHVEYFDAIIQQAQFKVRVLDSMPEFDYRLSHVDRWEHYDASRDGIAYPYTGSLRVSHMPSPHSPSALCLATSTTGPFQLLSISVELGYHGK